MTELTKFPSAMYEEFSTRIAGCFVNDDRDSSEISVHLRGWKHRQWSRDNSQHKVYLYVQIRVDDRLAHELDLNRRAVPLGLNELLRVYLCPTAVGQSYGIAHKQPPENIKGVEQVGWLCQAVDEYLQASSCPPSHQL